MRILLFYRIELHWSVENATVPGGFSDCKVTKKGDTLLIMHLKNRNKSREQPVLTFINGLARKYHMICVKLTVLVV